LTLTPGTRLGVYDIAAQIGEGGMGEVYSATDTKLKRQVAIKILPPALVMELVDGEDLSPRIARGAMPLDEALPIAKLGK
jgi:eukaryotic-like serine/threonine-protein kinase